MNKQEKSRLRSHLFRHLDGIVTAPIAFALHQKGVLTHLLEQQKCSLQELTETFGANEGYLNVGLRVLASQGWLKYEIKGINDIQLSLTKDSAVAFELVPLYEEVTALLQLSEEYHRRKFQIEPFLFLEKIFQHYQNRYGLAVAKNEQKERIQEQVLRHIEGIIVGPTAVALGMNKMFHKYFMEASFRPDEFHADGDSFARLLDMFAYLGWFSKQNETYRFTEKGLFFARRASAYGVTVSYIPMFRKVDELLFGDPSIFWNLPTGSEELHVDREMNVWGSGGSHSAYFKVVDDIIIDLFNQPIEQQPKGIVDMGCGNGAFLIHLYEIIEQRTLRGKMLEEHPLFLIGADYNKAALNVTRANILQADIWAKLIWGDIGQPERLAQDLLDHYGIQLKDLLHVRTFLDHNRVWQDPTQESQDQESTSTGAFAFRGRRLSNIAVEDNLREHLQSWAPFVARFGLLVIELHTIPPHITAQHLGQTAATAYDATHGFSDQFIVEIDVFHRVAEEADLSPVEKHFTRFPDTEWATVSVNLLKAQ